jgi:hypothetical protein
LLADAGLGLVIAALIVLIVLFAATPGGSFIYQAF